MMISITLLKNLKFYRVRDMCYYDAIICMRCMNLGVEKCHFDKCFNITFTRVKMHFDYVPDDVWRLFYDDPVPSEYIHFNNSLIPNFTDSFIYLCSFIKLTQGSITLTKDNIKLLHSSCIFDGCQKSEGNGGAVLFTCNSHIIQHRICAFDCYTPDKGQFAYTEVLNGSSNKNHFYESTILKSGQITSDFVVKLVSGIYNMKYSNFSKCSSINAPGFELASPTIQANISFNTLAGNTGINTISAVVKSGVFLVKNNNYVQNQITKDWLGIVSTNFDAEPNVTKNCFCDNLQYNRPFSNDDGNKFMNAYDNYLNTPVSTFGNVNVGENTQIKTLYELKHLSTFLCDAENKLGKIINKICYESVVNICFENALISYSFIFIILLAE